MTSENPYHLNYPDVQIFFEKWHGIQIAPRTTHDEEEAEQLVAKLDQCGKAYLTEFLGVNPQMVEEFLNDDLEAWYAVGNKQSAIDASQENVHKFWKKIQKIYPDLHSEREIEYLEENGVWAVMSFINKIDIIGGEISPVLREIGINAHAYK